MTNKKFKRTGLALVLILGAIGASAQDMHTTCRHTYLGTVECETRTGSNLSERIGDLGRSTDRLFTQPAPVEHPSGISLNMGTGAPPLSEWGARESTGAGSSDADGVRALNQLSEMMRNMPQSNRRPVQPVAQQAPAAAVRAQPVAQQAPAAVVQAQQQPAEGVWALWGFLAVLGLYLAYAAGKSKAN